LRQQVASQVKGGQVIVVGLEDIEDFDLWAVLPDYLGETVDALIVAQHLHGAGQDGYTGRLMVAEEAQDPCGSSSTAPVIVADKAHSFAIGQVGVEGDDRDVFLGQFVEQHDHIRVVDRYDGQAMDAAGHHFADLCDLGLGVEPLHGSDLQSQSKVFVGLGGGLQPLFDVEKKVVADRRHLDSNAQG